METVKTAATLYAPDVRRTMFVIHNQRTGATRPVALEDIEAKVQAIVLPQNAPDEVKDLLVTAKNLLLYSWHYYPFSMTASLQSAAAHERALKIRLNGAPYETLHPLLKRALCEKLLTNDGFPRWRAFRTAFRALHGQTEPTTEANLPRLLLKVFPHMRNVLAHGGRFVDDVGFLDLDIACEAIAQLFPQTATDERT